MTKSFVVGRKIKTSNLELLILHIKELADKSGITLDLHNLNNVSKTKKIYEKHQMEQLNNDSQFVELSNYIMKNINDNCVLTENEKSNYEILTNMGIFQVLPQDKNIESLYIGDFNNNDDEKYKEFDIEELKLKIIQKKQELSNIKMKHMHIKKQNEILKKHYKSLSCEKKEFDNLNESINEKNNKDDYGIDFTDFGANLENYKHDLINKSNDVLQPINNILKFLSSYTKVDVSIANCLKIDGMLNSTLKNDESVVQNYGGIFRVHNELNNKMNEFINFLTQNYIPNTFKKYGNFVNSCELFDVLNLTNTSNKMKNQEKLLKMLLMYFDELQSTSEEKSTIYDQHDFKSYYQNYSKMQI